MDDDLYLKATFVFLMPIEYQFCPLSKRKCFHFTAGVNIFTKENQKNNSKLCINGLKSGNSDANEYDLLQ